MKMQSAAIIFFVLPVRRSEQHFNMCFVIQSSLRGKNFQHVRNRVMRNTFEISVKINEPKCRKK